MRSEIKKPLAEALLFGALKDGGGVVRVRLATSAAEASGRTPEGASTPGSGGPGADLAKAAAAAGDRAETTAPGMAGTASRPATANPPKLVLDLIPRQG
jgi:hypothetical protein